MKELEFVFQAHSQKAARLVISPFSSHEQNLASIRGALGLTLDIPLVIVDSDNHFVSSFDNVPHGARLGVNLRAKMLQDSDKTIDFSSNNSQGIISAEQVDVPEKSTRTYRRAAVVNARQSDPQLDRPVIYVVKLLGDFDGAVHALYHNPDAVSHIFTVKRCMHHVSENWKVDLRDIFPSNNIDIRPKGNPRTWGNKLIALLSITSDCTPDSPLLVGEILASVATRRVEDPKSSNTTSTILEDDVVKTMHTIFEMTTKPVTGFKRRVYRHRKLKRKLAHDAAERGLTMEDPNVALLSKKIPSALSGLGERRFEHGTQKRSKDQSEVKLTGTADALFHELKLLAGNLTDDEGHTDVEADGYNSFGRQGCIDIIQDNWEDKIGFLLRDAKIDMDMFPRLKATKAGNVSKWQKRQLQKAGESVKDYLVELNDAPKHPLDLGIGLLAHLALLSEYTAGQGPAMRALLHNAVKRRQGRYGARKTSELLLEDVKRVIEKLV